MKKILLFIIFILCGCGFLTEERDVPPFNDPLDIKPMKLLWTSKHEDYIRGEIYHKYSSKVSIINNNNFYIHFCKENGSYVTFKFNTANGEKISEIKWDDSKNFASFWLGSYFKTNDRDFFFFDRSKDGNSLLYYFDYIKDEAKLIKIIDATKTLKILGVYKNSLIIHESNKVEVDYDGKLLNNTKYGNEVYLLDFETKTQEFITSFKEIEKENACFNYYTDDLGSSIIVASYTKNNGIKEYIMAYDLNNSQLLYSNIPTGYNNYKPNFEDIVTLISNFVVNNKSLFISSDIGSEIMRVFDVKTGKFIWSKQLPRHNVNSKSYQSEWSIYYTDKYLICFNEYFISSINPENGDILWIREGASNHRFSILNDIGYLLTSVYFKAIYLPTGVKNWDTIPFYYNNFYGTINGENGNKGKVLVGSIDEIFCYEAIK